MVRKARLPLSPEVRPLAPVRIEAMGAAAELRDATILSVLAYAGLRPGEAPRAGFEPAAYSLGVKKWCEIAGT